MTRFAALVRKARRASRKSGANAAVLPLSLSVEALGARSWDDAALAEVPVDRVVGTVARVQDFDRALRPMNSGLRHRWERVAQGMAEGVALPPPELIQLGELYFVADGHHRVSVARANGVQVIDALVRRVCTVAYACHCLTLMNLPNKAAERDFLERFPLPDDTRQWLWLDDPSDWALIERAAHEWITTQAGSAAETTSGLEQAVRSWWEHDVLPTAHSCRGDEQVTLEDYLCAVRDRIPDDVCLC